MVSRKRKKPSSMWAEAGGTVIGAPWKALRSGRVYFKEKKEEL
jgi:hypothetical protein